MKSFQARLETLKAVIRDENQEALRVMQKHGVKILIPTKEAVAEFNRLSDKAVQRPGAVFFTKKVLDEVTAYLEEYRNINK